MININLLETRTPLSYKVYKVERFESPAFSESPNVLDRSRCLSDLDPEWEEVRETIGNVYYFRDESFDIVGPKGRLVMNIPTISEVISRLRSHGVRSVHTAEYSSTGHEESAFRFVPLSTHELGSILSALQQ